MKAFKRFIKTVPVWAYSLVFLAVFTNTVYLHFYLHYSAERHAYLWSVYLLMVIFSITSLFLLYKKPNDKAVILFYLLLQCIFTTMNASYLIEEDLLALLATVGFIFSANLISPLLIHFLLIFPKPARFFNRYKITVILLYGIPGLFATAFATFYIIEWFSGSLFSPTLNAFNTASLRSGIFLIILAALITIYQYRTSKDTLSRMQLLLLMTGVLFILVLFIPLVLFYETLNILNSEFPYLIPLLNATTRLFLIGCILTAIFRYRIWNIEVIFKKALLYLGATVIIILVYLGLIFLVGLMVEKETNVTRFIILGISVLVFLSVRDRLQQLIDRLFHRETYDSATVVGDFEEKMTGIYKIEDLKFKVLNGLDEIFHFKSVALMLKADGLSYEQVSIIGNSNQGTVDKYTVNPEFEEMLMKNKVFSPGELQEVPSMMHFGNIELVVPVIKDGQPFGFFLCSPKKSEKVYSLQDIRILSLIAKRVVALFQTATLYQKDLDRQLMLERERARISQDMHDDIGASLTRISMMSEMVKNRDDVGDGARQWLGQISGTSRGLMEEMNQIIWALNPKNDNLEGLVTYIRRFAFEYLEPAKIKCKFDLPGTLPETALSVEIRRNIYLVVREALHNVVKHSGASRVDLRLKVEDSKFKISIKDDGKGFDPDKLEFPGNGLVNMKKRMNDIGGEIFINSSPGNGSEIEIIVQLS